MTARLERALLLYGQSRYELAEKELRLGLADDPDDAVAHALLSLCLSGRKDYTAATEEAERAVGCGPDLPLAHHALGAALHHRNREPEAEASAREAVRLNPADPDHHALLASIRAAREDWAGVLAAADEGLAHDPDHGGCVNLRAMALVRLGRRAEAGHALEGALGRAPEDAFTHANRGWTLLHENDPKQALVHFREALRLDPDLEFARVGMIEAVKARHWVYRQVLRYFLWMARLSPGARWGVVIGLLVLQRLTAAAAEANPALKPILDPLLVAYLVFVMTTWTAGPLSNLFLRFNRFGRLALSREQRAASNLVAVCLTGAVTCAGYGLAGPSDYNFLGWPPAMGFLFLLMPVSSVYVCDPGWPRRVMAAYSGLMAVAVLAAVGLFAAAVDLDRHDGRTALGYVRTGLELLQANMWAGLLSGFVANWLMTVRPRR